MHPGARPSQLSSSIGSMWMRRHTWYALTDRRAFIARDLPVMGRSLKSYPITAETVIDYQQNTLDSIYFASQTKRTKNGTRDVPIGFEQLDDGPHVLKLIRQIQQGPA